MKEYESHPAAKLFPMMSGDDMKELVSDIQQRGLLNPITLHQGMILDGRNRYAACGLANVQPRFETWVENGCSATAWAISQNLKRRQLSASQRAAVAVQALPMLEAEAKERQGARSDIKETIPESSRGQARDKAAAAVNVNPRYVSDAKKIKETAPEVFEQVERGEKTIPQAKRQLFGGGEVVAEAVVESRAAEAEKDSEKLWTLKSTWRQASKKDKAAFAKWIKSNK